MIPLNSLAVIMVLKLSVEVDNGDIDRFVDDDYLDPDALVESTGCDHRTLLTTGKQRFFGYLCVILVLPQVKQVVLHNISVLL